MIKRNVSIGIVILCIFFFMGCPQEANQDTWTLVKEVNEIDGTWEGSADVAIKKTETTPQTSITSKIQISYTKNASTIKTIYSMDFNRYIEDIMKSQNIPVSELTKSIFWDALKQSFTSSELPPEITIGKYTISINIDAPITSMDFNSNDNKTYINQSKNKLKLISTTNTTDNIIDILDSFPSEVILNKK